MNNIIKTLKTIFVCILLLSLLFLLIISSSKAEIIQGNFSAGDYWIYRVFQIDQPQNFSLEKHTIVGDSSVDGIPCWVVEVRKIGEDKYYKSFLTKKYLSEIKVEFYTNNTLIYSGEPESASNIKISYEKSEANFSYDVNVIFNNYSENSQREVYHKFFINESGLENITLPMGTFLSIHRETTREAKRIYYSKEDHEKAVFHSWRPLELNGIEALLYSDNSTYLLVNYKINNIQDIKEYNESDINTSIDYINFLKTRYEPSYIYKNNLNFSKVTDFLKSNFVNIISVIASIITIVLIVPTVAKILFPAPYSPNTYDAKSYFNNLPQIPISGINGFIVIANVRKLEKIRFIRALSLLSAVWFLLFAYISYQENGEYSIFFFLSGLLILRAYDIALVTNYTYKGFVYIPCIVGSIYFFITKITIFLKDIIEESGYDESLSKIGFILLISLFIGIGSRQVFNSVIRYWHGEKSYPHLSIAKFNIALLLWVPLVIFYGISYLSSLILLSPYIAFYYFGPQKPFDPNDKIKFFIDIISWFFMTPVIMVYVLYYLDSHEERDNKLVTKILTEIKKYGGELRVSILTNNLNIGIHDTLRLAHLISEKYNYIKLYKNKLKNAQFDFIIHDLRWKSRNLCDKNLMAASNKEEQILGEISDNDAKFTETLKHDLYSAILTSGKNKNIQEKWDLCASLYDKGLILPIFENEIEDRIWIPSEKIHFSQEIKISYDVIKKLKKKRTWFIPNIVYDLRNHLIVEKDETIRVLSLPHSDSFEEYDEYYLKVSETIKINGNNCLKNHFLVVIPHQNAGYIITYKELEKIWKNKYVFDYLVYLFLYKYR